MSDRRSRTRLLPPLALAVVLALAACGPAEEAAERPSSSADQAASGSPTPPDASAPPSPRAGTKVRGQSPRRVPLDDLATSSVRWQGEHGRMRDVAAARDGSVWALTGSTDGRGRPAEGDDRILVFEP